MRRVHSFLAAIIPVFAICAFSSEAQAQRLPIPPIAGPAPLPRGVPPTASLWSDDDRSGPRLGAAYLIGGSVTAERAGRHVAPVVSLFGWQLEHQFPTGRKDAPLPMTELVGLAGGMEQGVFLPSLSWLVGFRQTNGWEAAIGPTLTGAGIQLAAAAGITHAIGGVHLPVNLAVAPGRRGASVSITTGFNVTRGP